jgi:hypothetical protein
VAASPIRVILAAGAIAGALDITAAFLHAGSRGTGPVAVLKFVASGVLGTASFGYGAWAAALGLLLHFLIATIWAAIFYAASRKFPVLLEHAAISGALYGVLVHLLMQQIVVPLSLTPTPLRPETTWWNPALRYLIHIFCVGLPIALTVARYRRREKLKSAPS